MGVCVWIITKNEKRFLDITVAEMVKHSWVDMIYILHTDNSVPLYLSRLRQIWGRDRVNIREDYKFFGDGWDKSVENGGFDEVACRNYAIEKCESFGKDWLLQCDTDEYYTDSLKNVLNIGTGVVSFMCYNYFSILDGWEEAHHVRLWRPKEKLRYSMNTGKVAMAKHENKSIHCMINLSSKKVHPFNDPCWAHWHYLLGSKNGGVPSPGHELPDLLPEVLKNVWRNENGGSLC